MKYKPIWKVIGIACVIGLSMMIGGFIVGGFLGTSIAGVGIGIIFGFVFGGIDALYLRSYDIWSFTGKMMVLGVIVGGILGLASGRWLYGDYGTGGMIISGFIGLMVGGMTFSVTPFIIGDMYRSAEGGLTGSQVIMIIVMVNTFVAFLFGGILIDGISTELLEGYGGVGGEEYGILVGLLIGIGLTLTFLALMFYLFGKKKISDFTLSYSDLIISSGFFLAILLIGGLFQRLWISRIELLSFSTFGCLFGGAIGVGFSHFSYKEKYKIVGSGSTKTSITQKINEKISMDTIKSLSKRENTNRCSNCGMKNTEKSNYCKSCGEPLSGKGHFFKTEGSESIEGSKCNRCTTDNPDSANYCYNCGKKIGDGTVAFKDFSGPQCTCGVHNPEEANYCFACGAKIR